jgi:predicted NBD/HSP70 family sugar kinase
MGTQSLPRNFNRSAVLSELISAGEVDRSHLVGATGLSQATVFRVVDELLRESIIVEGSRTSRVGPGRAATQIRMNEKVALVAGVDLGGTNCRIVVSDALGQTLGRRFDSTPADLDATDLADWLAGNIYDLAVRCGEGSELGSVAIGLPGAVAGDKERVVGSQNLSQIRGTQFIDSLSEAMGVPTAIDNDSNLALLGELQYGLADPVETTVLLVLGTGLSAAVSLDGRVLSGREGLLGEFGRLPLPGGRYRVRDLLSGAGLVAYSADHGHPVTSSRELFADPEKHGPVLADVHDTLRYLVELLALSYEPQSILITGGFSESFDDATLARVSSETELSVGVRTSLGRSRLGGSAGLLGAMSLALSNLYLSLRVNSDDAAAISTDREAVVRAFEAFAPTRERATGWEG